MNGLDGQLSLKILQIWHSWGYPRWILILLEWLVHGIPWLLGSVTAFAYVCRWNYSKKLQFKFALLLLGIILDLFFIGVIKLIFRRQRPSYNYDDQIFEAPVADKYSFPSGHTSRATMLAILLIELIEIRSSILRLIIHTCPVILGLSRVALGRHFLTDILGGFVVGSIEAVIVLRTSPSFYLKATQYIPLLYRS